MIHNKRIVHLAVMISLFTAIIITSAVKADVNVGDRAPNFTLERVDDNGTISLSDYTQKPAVLVFWVSWCPHCQHEAPILEKIHKDLGAKGLNTVGVSVDEDRNNASTFIKKYGVTFPNAFAGTAAGQQVLETYNVEGVPMILVLDKGGTVKARYVGETDESTIRDQLSKLGVR